jgi:hypothetical protein
LIDTDTQSTALPAIIITPAKEDQMYKLLSILALITASGMATAATPSTTVAAKANTTASTQKYCFQMDDVTGSRLRSTECRTKADWKQQGVDVDELIAKKNQSDTKA